MKKALLVTYYFPPKIGGGEEYLYNIYKRLPSDKVVVLADDRGDESQVDFDCSQNFKIYRQKFFSGKFKPTWWTLVRFVKKVIQREGVEVIHFGHYAHYAILARILRIPYLVYIQGSDLTSYLRSWFGKWLAKLNLNKAGAIITNSQFLKDRVVTLGIDESKVEVVHPGLDLEKYDFSLGAVETRHALSLLGDKKIVPRTGEQSEPGAGIILSVGRLHKVKGFDSGIRALPLVLKQVPNAIYIIVGNGEEKESLQKLANKLGVEDKVVFAGEVADKRELSRYYKAADIYVGPSRAEGFGIVFLEARAFGLPIVASDIGGVREAVGDGGTLVKPGDIESLAENIVKILKNGEKYEPERNFDWGERVEEIKNIFDKLL